ncbi:MAG: hypothetical protein ABIS69_12135 [Sediminibacterium sp.]
MEDSFSSMVELQVDESAQTHLLDTSKWTRFLAIISFVFMGLLVLGLVFLFVFKDNLSRAFTKSPQFSQFGAMGTSMILEVISVIIVIGVGLFMVITYYLLRFSTQTTKGIEQQNQVALEIGIGSLKHYMIITGVLGIISLLFGLLQLFTIR